VRSFLEHPKNECLSQTAPFKVRGHIVFLISRFSELSITGLGKPQVFKAQKTEGFFVILNIYVLQLLEFTINKKYLINEDKQINQCRDKAVKAVIPDYILLNINKKCRVSKGSCPPSYKQIAIDCLLII